MKDVSLAYEVIEQHGWVVGYRAGYISCKIYIMMGAIRGLFDRNDTLLFWLAATERVKAYFPVSLTALCSLIYLFQVYISQFCCQKVVGCSRPK